MPGLIYPHFFFHPCITVTFNPERSFFFLSGVFLCIYWPFSLWIGYWFESVCLSSLSFLFTLPLVMYTTIKQKKFFPFFFWNHEPPISLKLTWSWSSLMVGVLSICYSHSRIFDSMKSTLDCGFPGWARRESERGWEDEEWWMQRKRKRKADRSVFGMGPFPVRRFLGAENMKTQFFRPCCSVDFSLVESVVV